jgi:hypothetical protein
MVTNDATGNSANHSANYSAHRSISRSMADYTTCNCATCGTYCNTFILVAHFFGFTA